MEEKKQGENEKRSGRRLLLVVAVLLIVFGALCTGYQLYTRYAAQQEAEVSSVVTEEAVSVSEKEGVKNPIDFKKLQKQNEEIYAWLKVPGTKVDYPIVQSAVSDDFYLKHSATDKSWIASGAVYTQMCNTRSFQDRVTVIYGHNGYGDTMFTTLHYFEKADFFAGHKRFYIYTPEARLTYRIVSAFKYDDRHIINSFDFQDNEVYRSFLTMIANPLTTNKNVADLGRELTLSDNVVVLSTCITNQPSNRYLVCGVLEKNEKTD